MRSKSIKKKIFVLSVGRSDYDRYFPILSELRKNLGIKVILFFIVLGFIIFLAKNHLWREVH